MNVEASMSETSFAAAGAVRALLRLEGAALFAAAVFLYVRSDPAWQPFAILFLAPDLAFVFYLAGARVGAIAYNLTHSTIGPILFALLAQLVPVIAARAPVSLAFIWLAHIGFDRALGYGLKYASGFGDTHLGFIGKHRTQPA